jgi:molecular chaperone GrpE
MLSGSMPWRDTGCQLPGRSCADCGRAIPSPSTLEHTIQGEVAVIDRNADSNGTSGEGSGTPVGDGKESSTAIQGHAPTQPVAVESGKSDHETEVETAAVDPLEEALKEAATNRDRWMRAVAELENFKKRTQQERSKLLKYRYEDLLRDLLPIVDNLTRAMEHCSAAGRSDPVTEGVCMILNAFKEVLRKYGVTEMETVGTKFNPEFHEALALQPAPDKEPNTVLAEIEKGYLYHDKMLRPAKVLVSSAGT